VSDATTVFYTACGFQIMAAIDFFGARGKPVETRLPR